MAELKQVVQIFDRGSISWLSSKWASWPVEFGVIRIIRKPISLIRSFNTKFTTEPCKYEGYSVWFAEASYTDKIFMY